MYGHWVVLAAGILLAQPWPAATALLLMLCDALATGWMGKLAGGRFRIAIEAPLGRLLNIAVSLAALTDNRVTWAGVRYRVRRGGRLRRID